MAAAAAVVFEPSMTALFGASVLSLPSWQGQVPGEDLPIAGHCSL